MLKRLSLFALATLLALSIAAFDLFGAALRVGAKAIHYAAKVARYTVFTIVAGPAPEPKQDRTAADRPLLVAKAFVRRLVQRHRPEVTPGWRMCPSA